MKELQTATRSDPILGKVWNYVRRKWPHHTSKCLQPYKKICQELTTEADCLLRGTRVIIPLKLRSKVLAELHQGYCGIVRMKALTRSCIWWSGLDDDIANSVTPTS